MSKALKVSGFAGLTVQMLWGMGNIVTIISQGGVPGPVTGAHAHFGVLSILAVVAGFAVAEFGVQGVQRSVAVYGFILGQWLLPATVMSELVMPQLMISAFLWGILLTASMAVLAYNAAQQ